MSKKCISVTSGAYSKNSFMKGPIVPNCLMSQRTAKLALIPRCVPGSVGPGYFSLSVPDTHFLNKNCTLKGF